MVVQDDRFAGTDSITVCAFTTDPTTIPLFRILIEPNDRNELAAPSRIMVDKITTVRKIRLGRRIGRLDEEDLVRLNRAILVVLGFA